MLSLFFHFIVFIFLLSSHQAFCIEEQGFLPETCKQAVQSSLFQNGRTVRQLIEPVETTGRADFREEDELGGVGQELQSLMTNFNQEGERYVLLERELRNWISVQSQKRLSEEELNIVQKNSEEELLKAQSFSSVYIKGLDEMNEMRAVAKRLREMKVEPYMTHIDYFANKIRDHIQFMEEGEMDSSQKRRLKLLREYGEKAIKERKVTYERWIRFNGMLIEVFSDEVTGFHESIEARIKRFPEIILMPTAKGTVGFITINEGLEVDIYPLGLSNKRKVVYDGTKGDPFAFFTHDLFHINEIVEKTKVRNSDFYRKMKKIRTKIRELPVNKREGMEFIYWYLTYEAPPFIPLSSEDIRLRLIFERPLLYIFYQKGNSQKGKDEIEKIINDFMEIYNSIQDDEVLF